MRDIRLRFELAIEPPASREICVLLGRNPSRRFVRPLVDAKTMLDARKWDAVLWKDRVEIVVAVRLHDAEDLEFLHRSARRSERQDVPCREDRTEVLIQ
jgi:hypothetical protein